MFVGHHKFQLFFLEEVLEAQHKKIQEMRVATVVADHGNARHSWATYYLATSFVLQGEHNEAIPKDPLPLSANWARTDGWNSLVHSLQDSLFDLFGNLQMLYPTDFC